MEENRENRENPRNLMLQSRSTMSNLGFLQIFPSTPIWGGLVFELSGRGRFDPEAAKDSARVEFGWGCNDCRKEKTFMTILGNFCKMWVFILLGDCYDTIQYIGIVRMHSGGFLLTHQWHPRTTLKPGRASRFGWGGHWDVVGSPRCNWWHVSDPWSKVCLHCHCLPLL